MIRQSSREYRDWNALLADAGKFWIGFTKSDVLMAQQSEADLLCLLRRKFGLTDREAMRQISDYLGAALTPGRTIRTMDPSPEEETPDNYRSQ